MRKWASAVSSSAILPLPSFVHGEPHISRLVEPACLLAAVLSYLAFYTGKERDDLQKIMLWELDRLQAVDMVGVVVG